MRLSIGIIGVLLCLASAVLLGLDISRYITSGILDGNFRMTTILELMRSWTPIYWTETVNFINTQPKGPFTSTLVNYGVSIPATIIGLLIGFGLVMFGFKIQRYRY